MGAKLPPSRTRAWNAGMQRSVAVLLCALLSGCHRSVQCFHLARSSAIHSSCSPPDSSDCLAVLLCAPLKGGHTFSRDSSMVALYSRHTRALTVANFSQRAPARLCPRLRREQQVLFLQVSQKRVTDLASRNPIKSLSSCDIKK